MADVGDMFQQTPFAELGEFHSPYGDGTAVVSVSSREQRGQGGFAAAGFPHQGGKGPCRTFQRNPVQDLPALLVLEAHLVAADGTILRHGPFPGGGNSQIQQAEDLLAGGHAVHGNVKERPQQPHGKKKIRGQNHNQQTAEKVDLSPTILGHSQDDPQRRSPISHQVHDGDGVELHGQHLHGDLSKTLGLLVHLLLFEGVRLVDFQGRQPLEVLQKCVPQRGILPPVL